MPLSTPAAAADVDAAAEEWIRGHVQPVGPIEVVHDRPWATVRCVPVAGGLVWFKACAPTQAFEPQVTASLFGRWPKLVSEVLAYDVDRRWLLLADAGSQARSLGNPPELWIRALPRYAELQRGEAVHVDAHLAAGVPDLRVASLPEHYDDLLPHGLSPKFARRFADLCEQLESAGLAPSVEHGDMHMNNLYVDGDQLRIIDWGDAAISHPFFSLVTTFRFLEEFNGLHPGDPWFNRLRDAYLEPWGPGHEETIDLALRVGSFARAFTALRIRNQLPPGAIPDYDTDFQAVLQRAVSAGQR